MNVYPLAVDAFLRGEINVLANTIKAQMVAGFAYDPTHADIDDVTDTVSAPVTVAVDRVEAGTVWLVDPVVFPSVAAGPAVTALVAYVIGGPLLAHIDRRDDTVPLFVVPDGGPLTFTFDRLFKL